MKRSLKDRDPQPSECSQFQLVLSSTAPSPTTAKTKTLTLDCYPETTLDIKKEIQKQLHIPTFAQTVQYEQMILSDSDSPGSVRIRSGDTLQVTYESEAQCVEIDEIVAWLKKLANHIRVRLPSLRDENPSEAAVLLNVAVQQGLTEKLQSELFLPWLMKKKQMNKRYFLHTGGVDLLLEVYSLLLKQDWQDCTPQLQSFELTCLNTLYNLVSTFELRQVFIDRGCIELCMQSLLRVKLKRGKSGVEGIKVPEMDILMDVITSALGALCNMCEVREAHLKIGSNPEALEQFICVAQFPTDTCWHAELSASAFVCFAHEVEIHPHLTSPDVITGLVTACHLLRNLGSKPMEILLLEYFTALFLAQLTLVSPQLIPHHIYSIISQHMSRFLSSTTPYVIAKHEWETGYVWSVFLPYIKLLYVPTLRFNSSGNLLPSSTYYTARPICPQTAAVSITALSNLLQLSIETTIFSLQVMLLNEDSRKRLLKENLCNFIVCLPSESYLPDSLHENAKELVLMLGAYMPLQPSRLSLLAKARLAKMYFGLERMLQVHSVNELYAELYC